MLKVWRNNREKSKRLSEGRQAAAGLWHGELIGHEADVIVRARWPTTNQLLH